ncbi:MAG: membrane-bound PQQ-dependent dehydrogenase, glucose/quinate/shikimate family [Rhizobiales bacterium]|nr:membrane-bound PQQ-dependent dehydrogenase, glucose/quinate/shikimate family [Hyphomicrobiales bacterium]
MEKQGPSSEGKVSTFKAEARLVAGSPVVRILLSSLTGLSGVVLFTGGVWLALLGGAYFYWLAGLALLVVAVLIFRRSAWTYWLVALLILFTLIWSVSEVGLDFWQLVPRLDLIAALALILILPGVARQVRFVTGRAFLRSGCLALACALGASGIVAIAAAIQHPHDRAGKLPKVDAENVGAVFAAGKDWRAYGGTDAGTRYSSLIQITPQNVNQLKPAWVFHTGDLRRKGDPIETTYEVTPLKVDDTLYLCTPHDLVFALDAETGKEKWRYDPKIRQPPFQSTQHLTCRGVAYVDRPSSTATDCNRQIFLPTVDGRLIALNADTGAVCVGFGVAGSVDLWRNMPNVTPGSYYSTSPPLVAKNLVIVGGAVNDNVSLHETSGVIRAFDIQTGDLVWNWDSRKPDETKPIARDATYSENSPNSWSISSYDPQLGLIFVPMGNQPPDEFGGNRDANVEKYSSSVVALDAATGAVVWTFQGTHHDLWDMDIPAQPSLFDLTINGETIPSVVIVTKPGEIFVLDRRTGKPVLPVVETAAPQGGAGGDTTAPTQPVSALSFNPPVLTESAMWGISPFDQLACRIKFRKLRYQGRYTPPSERGSITYPGSFGVFNWGGMAIDPERKIAFGMPVNLAFVSTLVPRRDDRSRLVTGEADPPFNENFGSRYAVKIAPFVSLLHIPCQAPPWGFVAGASLQAGKIVYRHVNGTVRDLSRVPLPLKLGVPGIGGPIITRGGLAFLSGTLDNFVRAYDVTTGKQLWESRLPAGGQATPMTYWSNESQRQFVVVVAGGHGSLGTKAGDSIIAYALPKK